MAELKAKEYQRFEDIKHITDEGMEFWYARELAPALEYTEWRNFNKVIDKAMLACKNSGFEVSDHFVEVNKMIEIADAFNQLDEDNKRLVIRGEVKSWNSGPMSILWTQKVESLC